MKIKKFALVDGNNFYCSCERVFRPSLRGKPLVVLSNNDGCVIARSEESKVLGIAMGAPLFQIQSLVNREGVHVFSANFGLYGDMSQRMMSVLSSFSSHMEIYSIDEAFLGLDQESLSEEYGQQIRSKVGKWLGLPVSVGLGKTKVRAKLANRWAKKHPECRGVCDLEEQSDPDHILAQIPVGDVWGVGRQTARRLQSHGISTALGLKEAVPGWIRKNLGVVGERLLWELNGISCFEIQEEIQPRQSVMCSRSFGRPVSQLLELEEALCAYVARAAEKVREQRLVASAVQVFLITNKHRQDQPQHMAQGTADLSLPTADSSLLMSRAVSVLRSIYRPGHAYKKVGVVLCGLGEACGGCGDLFEQSVDTEKRSRLMRAVDGINMRWGSDAVYFAAEGIARPWRMKSGYRSPRYTSCWNEIPKV